MPTGLGVGLGLAICLCAGVTEEPLLVLAGRDDLCASGVPFKAAVAPPMAFAAPVKVNDEP